MAGSATILRADARHLPLADGSVDLIVTSPPYYALRSYTDGGEHYDGQIGAEPTPAEYIASLIDCTREWMRVLKPGGSIWVNLGDKYNGGGGTAGHSGANGAGQRAARRSNQQAMAIPVKSLLGLPWRYAIRCMDDLGLILRRDQIWCLSGGARVYARTSTGDRPIMLRDLARHYRPEDVQLWNGEQWTQVRGWNRTPDDEGALEFELRTGERIGCTRTHQWPTNRGLLRADEIRVGDVIETTRLPEPPVARAPALLPDDDIGWLVGLYIAEGSRSETTIQFAGHIREDARHARLARIADAYDGTCAVYQTSEHGVTCNLHGSVLVGIIDRYVSQGTAKTKRLRHAAWQRSGRFLSAVVEGYLSGDGHYDAKNDRWRLGFTANDEWAADLRTLAARLNAVLRLRRAQHTMSGRRFPGWHGEWRWTRSTHGNAKRDGEVVAIRGSRARDFYDLGVADEPHLFALASGVLTHNSKPNGLPESVTDRTRSSHEYWFHLVKQPRYFAAVDEIREGIAESTRQRWGNDLGRRDTTGGKQRGTATSSIPGEFTMGCNPLGKLPGSVWEIPTEPLIIPDHVSHARCCGGRKRADCTDGLDHYAAFPTEWPRRIILGWSPSGICTACGEGRRPVGERERPGGRRFAADQLAKGNGRGWHHGDPAKSGLGVPATESCFTITGEACACPDTSAPTCPAVVLDPFGGTGTTALVAKALGRHGISSDMSADYCRLATWRTTDPGELAKAMRVPKPPKPLDGQGDLFAEIFKEAESA